MDIYILKTSNALRLDGGHCMELALLVGPKVMCKTGYDGIYFQILASL